MWEKRSQFSLPILGPEIPRTFVNRTLGHFAWSVLDLCCGHGALLWADVKDQMNSKPGLLDVNLRLDVRGPEHQQRKRRGLKQVGRKRS